MCEGPVGRDALAGFKHEFLHLIGALEGVGEDVLDDRLGGLLFALRHLEVEER